MKTRHYDDLLVRHDIHQTVREPTEPSAAKLSPYQLILEGILLDCGKRRVYGTEKLGAQPGTSLIIPVSDFSDIGFGLRPNYERPIHL